MKKSRKLLIPTLALAAIVSAGVAGASQASAFGFGANRGENKDSLIQKLVERFNLSKDDVEGTFEDHRNQMQEERKIQQQEHLSELVSEGKLTEDQKNALIAKREEWKTQREQNREEFQNMTREQRREEMEEHREEMDQWFEEQGIDHEALGGRGEGMGGRRHGGSGFGNK